MCVLGLSHELSSRVPALIINAPGNTSGSVAMDEKRKAIEKLAYPTYPAMDGEAALSRAGMSHG